MVLTQHSLHNNFVCSELPWPVRTDSFKMELLSWVDGSCGRTIAMILAEKACTWLEFSELEA